jgi:hypothetical protein
MIESDANSMHRLFGKRGRRLTYRKTDFLDYGVMLAACAAVAGLAYGRTSVLAMLGYGMCVLLLFSFPLRHGIVLRMPLIVRRPQDVLYAVVYKIMNIRPVFLAAVAVLLLEQFFIAETPDWPHLSNLMCEAAIGLFYAHLILITAYRTATLIAHWRKQDLVREILMQTVWKSVLARQPNVGLQILHAYLTGLLTHLILVAPWYMVLTHVRYSILTLPLVLIVNFAFFRQYMKTFNEWYYRDHWLGHNSEIEFLYLHGSHHDAIPSGLIGVSGNGFLEGFLRHSLGNPMALYGPLAAFLFYTLDVLMDINNHQYIPGIFPKLPRKFHERAQHSTHHFGRLEPYGVGLRVDDPGGLFGKKWITRLYPPNLRSSYALDERLNGFEWKNARHRQLLELYDRYNEPTATLASEAIAGKAIIAGTAIEVRVQTDS